MRHENPLYMAETAAAADLLAAGRLQLGLSRGSPEPARHGAEAFGYPVDVDEPRQKTALFPSAIAGAGVVPAEAGGRPGNTMLAVQPQSPGLADRIWWGSGSPETAVWAGEQGVNLMELDPLGRCPRKYPLICRRLTSQVLRSNSNPEECARDVHA